MIDITGIDPAEVLAALFNASRAQGMGLLSPHAQRMTVDEARELLRGGPSFDYVRGRVMKVKLGGTTLDPRRYDRDNGDGAALRAIEALRSAR